MSALKKPFIVMSLLLIFALSAYGAYVFTTPGVASIEPSAGNGAPEAMPVDVMKVSPQKIQIWKSFSGSVVAVDRAEIRPQVSGRITEIKFEDGQYVEKGAVLIVIDPRPYEAALNQAKAALSSAKTQEDLAEKEFKRAKELIKTDAVSQRLLDERSHAYDRAKAAVQEAQAQLEQAEINLDYAFVKAPISGKTSRAEITEGNLVQTGSNAPLLTTIVADQNLYVDFEIDDQTYMRSVRRHAQGQGGIEDKIPVRLNLLNGDVEYNGFVQSFDNVIDQATGTIRARALFDNREGILLPGMTVTVRMGSNGHEGYILVPERAVGTDQDRKFVYVVDENNTATYREIKLGESVNGSRIVLSGLEKGETVITKGLVKIRPNMPVTPKQASQKSTASNQALNTK